MLLWLSCSPLSWLVSAQGRYFKTAEPGHPGRDSSCSNSSLLFSESWQLHPASPCPWPCTAWSASTFEDVLFLLHLTPFPLHPGPRYHCPVCLKPLSEQCCLSLRLLCILPFLRNRILTDFLFHRKQVDFPSNYIFSRLSYFCLAGRTPRKPAERQRRHKAGIFE